MFLGAILRDGLGGIRIPRQHIPPVGPCFPSRLCQLLVRLVHYCFHLPTRSRAWEVPYLWGSQSGRDRPEGRRRRLAASPVRTQAAILNASARFPDGSRRVAGRSEPPPSLPPRKTFVLFPSSAVAIQGTRIVRKSRRPTLSSPLLLLTPGIDFCAQHGAGLYYTTS